MKKILLFSLLASTLLLSNYAIAQADKSKRPSPPDSVTATTTGGNTITINYSQPSVKGRTIGKDIASYGKVWRAGANEATTFEISKAAKIEGQYPLPAGKYGLYAIPGEKDWTIIFNKTWKQWGTVYNENEDALRVIVPAGKSSEFAEKLNYKINKNGVVTLTWGNTAVSFKTS
jgi:hypothetical protein